MGLGVWGWSKHNFCPFKKNLGNRSTCIYGPLEPSSRVVWSLLRSGQGAVKWGSPAAFPQKAVQRGWNWPLQTKVWAGILVLCWGIAKSQQKWGRRRLYQRRCLEHCHGPLNKHKWWHQRQLLECWGQPLWAVQEEVWKGYNWRDTSVDFAVPPSEFSWVLVEKTHIWQMFLTHRDRNQIT